MSTPLLKDFPELSQYSREDLEDMLNSPAYFEAVFHSLPQVKGMFQAQSELGRANEEIAKSNSQLQNDLYASRSETKDAFDRAKALEARWRELEREQRDVYQRFSQQFLLLRLRHAITAQDDASEALASTFVQASPAAAQGDLNGKDVDEFVKEFKESRKVYHKRLIWAERWAGGRVQWRDD